ncbi:MAG: SDR family NAD(P)-dependent oxidoreductase [Prochloraceae cyanobacterium]
MSKNLFALSDKVAIVTGSARGLGKAIALGLADAGAKLVIADLNYLGAEATAREIRENNGAAIAIQADVSVRQDCQQLVNKTVEHYDRLDITICNAGIDIIKPAESLEEEEWDAIINVNLKGYFNVAQLAARQMIARGTGGSIVMNSSIASLVGIEGLVAYAAAKGGVNQLVRTMAVEWASKGIRVNAFAPGYFENIMQGAGNIHADPKKQQQIVNFTPMARRGKPEELIGPVIFLASEASSYVTGSILMVDGGYSAI